MDVSLKVTDQPQESSFFDLVSGDNVLSIPLFQRQYRWAQKNLDWLLEDIEDIKIGLTKSCFLGVIVCVSRGASPGRPIHWEIVDGQQRLTTLYLLLLAATEVAARKGVPAWAAGVIGTYLLVRPLADNPTNTKLVPSFADRAQFKKIWDGVMAIPEVANHPNIVANLPRPPAPSGAETGAMSAQFGRMKRKIAKIFDDGGQEAISRFVDITAGKLSAVSISLRDPLAAPKIFERLNNRAELVTVADLVRNEVFSKASDDPAMAAHVFSNHWEPFSNHFAAIEGGLEKFLFPYGLILNKGATKADLFSNIRAHWASFPKPDAIISDMQKYVGTFSAIELGQRDLTMDPELQAALDRLHRLGKPSSIYAFVMRLCLAAKKEEVSAPEATAILGVIECFLFRRAICGIEPTGLHAVFKGLWFDLTEGLEAPGVTANAVHAAISSKPTVSWPDDAEFESAIKSGDLYNRKVVKYALREFEYSREGESPEDDFQVEHVLPQAPTEHWRAIFGERHEELVNCWANLLPLTGRMNIDAGQEPYETKREEYEKSIFATTREVQEKYLSWSPVEIEMRSVEIASWAKSRWPLQRT
jgi:hypothetical protein